MNAGICFLLRFAAAVIKSGKTAFRGLSVLMAKIDSCFIHGFAHHIIADISGAAQEIAKVTGVHRPHSHV